MLGWNEQLAVCSQKAISAGNDAVQEVTCDNRMAGSGSLVLFTCDIDAGSLPALQFSNAGDFSSFHHKAIGIKVESYMFQCIETTEKREVKTQGGGKDTITTYRYHRDWKSDAVSSARFGTKSRQARDAFNSGCQGMQNPPWNPRAPKAQRKLAQKMNVGAFTTTMTDKVPIDTPVQLQAPPLGWRTSGAGEFYLGQPSYAQIGDVKVRLMSNSPRNMKATVLGRNDEGMVAKWTAPSSWLCSGFKLSDLRMGTISKEDFFTQLASEATALTWILRFIGFILMWVAFSLCFGPLEVAGDCIPCVGPWIGDGIAAVTCCVACLPATGCTLGVAGLVWMAMRPHIGIPLMLAFVIIFGGLGFYIAKQKRAKQAGQVAVGAPNPNYGAAQVLTMAQPAVAIAQPIAPQPPSRHMQVQAPLESFPGQLVQVQTPDGTTVSVQVPQGIQPGGIFTVSY